MNNREKRVGGKSLKYLWDNNTFFLFNVYLFILREREHKQGSGDTDREGDTESESGSRLRAVSTEPNVGAQTPKLRDHDLSGSHTCKLLSHPGAPG